MKNQNIKIKISPITSEKSKDIKLPKAAWLLEESTTSKLYVIDDIPTRISKKVVIDLDVPFADGTNLLESINRKWQQLVIDYAYLVRNSHGSEVRTAAKHKDLVYRLITFLSWCRLNGFYSLENINDSTTEQYTSEILYGSGYALRYVDRLKDYFEGRKEEDIPTFPDPTCQSRMMVDTAGILKSLGINSYSLASDPVGSAYLKKHIAKAGYRSPQYSLSILDELPKPEPIARVNHKRYMSCIRNLYIWRKQLGSESLNFLPCAGVFEAKFGWYKTSAGGHTKNIPPIEAMKLLDSSLSWVYDFGPKVLTIYDGVKKLHENQVQEANKFEQISSPEHIELMHKAYQRYLEDEDMRGILPSSFPRKLAAITGLDNTSCKNVIFGKFDEDSRIKAKEWLGISYKISDEKLQQIFKDKAIDSNKLWSQTWPYTVISAANQIGISEVAMRKFLQSNQTVKRAGEVEIYEFLVSKGYLESLEFTEKAINGKSRYIDNALAEYVKSHPLNIPNPDPSSPFPLNWNYGRTDESGNINIYDAIRYLIPMSAFIVIGIFSARRDSELMGLETDCIRQDESGYWLRSHIAKTFRIDKEIPTVKVVKDAVELLIKWGERGRNEDSKKLFSHWIPISEFTTESRSHKDLNIFAKMTLNFQMKQKIQTRQFRRFFAVTYFWRYKLAKLPALTQFLCHFSVAMTKEYVTEMVSNEIFSEVNNEFSRDILINAAIGEKPIGGQFSRVWRRKIQQIRSSIQENIEFVSEEDYQKIFLDAVNQSIRTLTPTPGGACASRNLPRDVIRAKCSQVEPQTGVLTKIPNLSTPSKCGSCPFSITDEDHRDYWADALNRTNIAVHSSKGLLKELAKKDAVILGRFYSNNFSRELNEKTK